MIQRNPGRGEGKGRSEGRGGGPQRVCVKGALPTTRHPNLPPDLARYRNGKSPECPGLSFVCVFVWGSRWGSVRRKEHTPSQLPPHHPWGLTSVASWNLGHIREQWCRATYNHLFISFITQSDILEAKVQRAFFLSVCGDIYRTLQAQWPDRRIDLGRLCWPHHAEHSLPTTGSAPSKTHKQQPCKGEYREQ